jgi:flagellar biosynthesis component FlhA
MFEQQSHESLPTIGVSLQLDAAFGCILDADGPLHEAVRENAQQKLANVVRLLGVPGTVALDIEPLQATEQADSQWLSLRVNGALCRYPEEVLTFAWSYATGRQADAKSAEVRSQLQEVARAPAEEHGSRVSEFFGLACAEIVSRQPAVLLGPAQVAAYGARLEGQAVDEQPNPSRPDTGRLLRILERVLEMRISIADTEKVASVLADSGGAPWEAVVEDLVDALAPEVVELHIPEAYVARLTTQDDEGSNLLTFVLESMFTELGIAFPPLRPVPTTELKPNSFRFYINHLPTLPVIGLEADECLVNDTPERLRLLGIEGRKAVNPASQQPAAIVGSPHKDSARWGTVAAREPERQAGEEVVPGLDARQHQTAAIEEKTNKEMLEAAGFTTWDQAGYCVLCLAEALRRNGASFVHRRSIEIQLEHFGQAYPALMEVTRARVSVEQVTRVLRMLVSEEVSIRNLRLILERLLDYRFRTSDLERYLILDDRLSSSGHMQDRYTDDLVSFVRTGLKRHISNKYARGTSTLVVYLVDPELENLFDGSNTDEVRQETFITALANELSYLPPTAQTPSILTAIGVRAGLRDAIRLRFPRIGVLAYQELRPDVNVQPVARISLR